MVHPSAPTDDRTVLINKIKQACTSYESAVKKYLGCVKDMEKSLEVIAISIRQLSQGEENDTIRSKADSFCTAVDRHISFSAGTPGQSKSHRSADTDVSISGGYPFSTYMNDLTGEVTAAMEGLKSVVKTTEKSKTKHDDLLSKYFKKCAEVDELETKLAKKNKGIDNNEKFASKVADRDQLKAQVEADDRAFRKVLQNLFDKRTTTLQRVVLSLQTHSMKYFSELSKAVHP
ncbi:hypothetical protein JKF63_04873 [Porcisia hertigi]|uniref:BAR domain-containing protein n=1 Tax=Porcisia hertigi TaxID=2761500 RepID=A0A836I4D1_9TRYP|nr:hypothetical protein JKF63_04873 [Porcisia hertigi]